MSELERCTKFALEIEVSIIIKKMFKWGVHDGCVCFTWVCLQFWSTCKLEDFVTCFCPKNSSRHASRQPRYRYKEIWAKSIVSPQFFRGNSFLLRVHYIFISWDELEPFGGFFHFGLGGSMFGAKNCVFCHLPYLLNVDISRLPWGVAANVFGTKTSYELF